MGNLEGKRLRGGPSRRWEDIEMDLERKKGRKKERKKGKIFRYLQYEDLRSVITVYSQTVFSLLLTN